MHQCRRTVQRARCIVGGRSYFVQPLGRRLHTEVGELLTDYSTSVMAPVATSAAAQIRSTLNQTRRRMPTPSLSKTSASTARSGHVMGVAAGTGHRHADEDRHHHQSGTVRRGHEK